MAPEPRAFLGARRGAPSSGGGRPVSSFGLDEPLLTVEDAAQLLAVRPSTIYEWVRSGRMPHLRLGPRAIRFTRPMLAEWVESRRADGPGVPRSRGSV